MNQDVKKLNRMMIHFKSNKFNNRILVFGLLTMIGIGYAAILIPTGMASSNSSYALYSDPFLDAINFGQNHFTFVSQEPCAAYYTDNITLFDQLCTGMITPATFENWGGFVIDLPGSNGIQIINPHLDICFIAVMSKSDNKLIRTMLKFNPTNSLDDRLMSENLLAYDIENTEIKLGKDTIDVDISLGASYMNLWSYIGGIQNAVRYSIFGVMLASRDTYSYIVRPMYPVSLQYLAGLSLSAASDLRIPIPTDNLDIPEGSHTMLVYLIIGSIEDHTGFFIYDDAGITLTFIKPNSDVYMIVVYLLIGGLVALVIYARKNSSWKMKRTLSYIGNYFAKLSSKNRKSEKEEEPLIER